MKWVLIIRNEWSYELVNMKGSRENKVYRNCYEHV